HHVIGFKNLSRSFHELLKMWIALFCAGWRKNGQQDERRQDQPHPLIESRSSRRVNLTVAQSVTVKSLINVVSVQGYHLSRSSITFSIPLTTRVNRSYSSFSGVSFDE